MRSIDSTHLRCFQLGVSHLQLLSKKGWNLGSFKRVAAPTLFGMPAVVESPKMKRMSIHRFLEDVFKFDELGTHTRIETKVIEGQKIPFYINEFWTSKQRAASSLHEVSYRACFKPQLPRFFIERLTDESDTVYDPFMGRGTTPLEAALLGRRALANDINPLSKILCGPRFSPPQLTEISQRLDELDLSGTYPQHPDQLAFFHPDTLNQLEALREYFFERKEAKLLDSVDQWIRMVATNRLTGHSPGFFSVYTLPPNQAVSAHRQRKINEKREQRPEAKDVRAIILKKSKSLLSKLTVDERRRLESVAGSELLSVASAENTPLIPDRSVDLVVTSPPFLDVVDYRLDNWLRCWLNGIDSKSLPLSQLKKEEDWIEKMTLVFAELKRVIKPSGVIAFEVGEVKGGKVLLENLVVKAAHQAGLKTHAVLINDQSFTKTSNCWGVSNKVKGTNTNRIVMISK